MAESTNKGVITLRAGSYDEASQTEQIREVVTVDVDKLVSAFGQNYGGWGSGGRRSAFNQDFTKYVFASRKGHVIVVDLRANTAVDITEPRASSGFSSGGDLDEAAAGFEPIGASWVYSDRVVVLSQDGPIIVDPDNPTAIERFTLGEQAITSLRAGPYGIDGTHSSTVLAPDGRFTASYQHVEFLAQQRVAIDYNCRGAVEGWYSDRTAVLYSSGNGPLLTTFDDAGNTLGCHPVLPPNERKIVDKRLRFDSAALLLAVRGDNGIEYYSADLSDPGSEPAPIAEILEFPNNWRLFYGYRD